MSPDGYKAIKAVYTLCSRKGRHRTLVHRSSEPDEIPHIDRTGLACYTPVPRLMNFDPRGPLERQNSQVDKRFCNASHSSFGRARWNLAALLVLIIRHLFPEFGELWSGSPAIPCTRRHASVLHWCTCPVLLQLQIIRCSVSRPVLQSLVMAALRSRCGHYIFVLFLLFPFFLGFFLAYNLSGRRLTGCLPYFHTWCGLSANLECRSEMYCTRLAENTGRKKSPSRHYHTTLTGCIFATKAYIDNRKKNC